MCGIVGYWGGGGDADVPHEARVRRMADALRQRGPDADGAWVDRDAGVALGHRRLSIIDLSAEGAQPMTSPSGRYVISFNGEVYSFRALRVELEAEGYRFRGGSDTEVVLAAIEAWGLERALERFTGMFAFGLWDRRERRLHLVRDRLGIKPLVYARFGSTVVFGSELKALEAHPAFAAEVDRGALASLLRVSCIPAPRTIWRDVFKLPPGAMLTVTDPAQELPEPRRYWRLEDVAAVPRRSLGIAEAGDELEALLRTAVRDRLVSDVPLGAFLSGGVDSSTVVALMAAEASKSPRTFSIGFEAAGFDEAPHARAVAQHLGTDHTELYVSAADALAVIPRMGELSDEPFADSSLIPTYLVSQLTRRHVTVSLSGDGGDELFAGYNRHIWIPQLWRRLRRLPAPARRLAARLLKALPPAAWDRIYPRLAPHLPARLRVTQPGEKVRKLAELLPAASPDAIYQSLVSHWKDPHAVVIGGREQGSAWPTAWPTGATDHPAERAMLIDAATYLPDDILTKVDRASMAVSLEARVPLIDHRVVEYAWSLPLELKLKDGVGKRVLREVLYRHVPQNLIERPKAGFALPLAAWLRGPLRDWAEDLLAPARLRSEGYLRAAPIRQRWKEHLSGRRSWEYHLWDVLMFQQWLAGR